MTYDSSLSAFEGEVIPEVASFKEEGLVTPDDEWNARMLKVQFHQSFTTPDLDDQYWAF